MGPVSYNTAPLDRMMEKGVRDSVFSGAVLLVSVGDTIHFHKAFGASDHYFINKVRKESLFDLASLTKPLATALAILKLVERGDLSLESDLGSIVESLAGTDKAGITVEQLLRHTSGLPAYHEIYKEIAESDKLVRQKRLREFVAAQPLICKPGSRQIYSDLGYMLLAWIVGKVSGERVDRFVEKMIYAPLGVQNLFYIDLFASSFSSFIKKYQKRVVATERCPWRGRVLRGEVHDENAWIVGGIEGHAGLFGDALSVWRISVEIMRTFGEDIGTLFEKSVLQDFLKKESHGYVAGFDTPAGRDSASGRYFSKPSIGHLGFTGTSFWIDLENRIIVVLLSNRVHYGRNNLKIKKFRPQIHNLVMEIFLHNND